jgi:DNA-binding MarR family transcriptional regulator
MHSSNVVAAWVMSAHDQLLTGMRKVDLEPRELAALTLVISHDGCSLDWLRSRVGLTQSGTVRLVDRLTARGLLRRVPATGRSVPLGVTRRGAQRLARWHQARDETVEGLLADLPSGQRRALIDSMGAGLAAHERERPQADATCRTCSWEECGKGCPVDRSVAARA